MAGEWEVAPTSRVAPTAITGNVAPVSSQMPLPTFKAAAVAAATTSNESKKNA
jgi:hypothetical protein